MTTQKYTQIVEYLKSYYTNKKKNYFNNLLDLKNILNENRD